MGSGVSGLPARSIEVDVLNPSDSSNVDCIALFCRRSKSIAEKIFDISFQNPRILDNDKRGKNGAGSVNTFDKRQFFRGCSLSPKSVEA